MLHTIAGLEHQTESVLCYGVSLLSCQFEQFCCFCRIFWDIFTPLIRTSEFYHGIRIALLCGTLQINDCLRCISFRHNELLLFLLCVQILGVEVWCNDAAESQTHASEHNHKFSPHIM